MSSSDKSESATSDAAELNPDAANASVKTDGAEGASGTDLGAQLEAAKAEASQAQDRYLRSVADLENFRRRTIREKDEIKLYATSRVLEDLLPVIDNLSLGLAAAKQPNADLKTLTSGVDMVLQQAKTALASHGLKEINPVGLAFDPHQHEAISKQPSDDVKAEHVVTVVRTGYSLNGRLLRPASVVISSGKAGDSKA